MSTLQRKWGGATSVLFQTVVVYQCALMSFFFFNNVKADCVSFILDVKVCYRVLLGYNLKLLCSRCSLCWRKLISWVCQAAMRALQATGSCYHSQVQHADKLTMTAEPSQGVCTYMCVHYAHMWVCVRVCFPGPEDRSLSMAAEIVGIPGIPPDSKQPVTRQEGERGLWERERAFCQSYPLWNGHRCNISQDKGSSV